MIWGEVINALRNLHRDLVVEFSVPPALFSEDRELQREIVVFPAALDDFDEWIEPVFEEPLAELIPLHPVERVLVEGPLLPIQKIKFASKAEIDALFASMISLEKEWFTKCGIASLDKTQYIENFLVVQALKLSVRAGFGKFAALKGKENGSE
jgi:hypothetical protein